MRRAAYAAVVLALVAGFLAWRALSQGGSPTTTSGPDPDEPSPFRHDVVETTAASAPAATESAAAPVTLAAAPLVTVAASTLPPSTIPATTAAPAATTTVPTTTTTVAAAVFGASILPLDQATRARMTSSWREGCPVPLDDLRLLTLDHWGFDGRVRQGELVVHADQAEAVVAAYSELFAARFPIERIELVDVYGADDDASMAANNTSAFNCREVTGRPGVWSEHSYGRAIDINPVQNPYVTGGGTVLPPAGAAYVTRDPAVVGLIVDGGPVVDAFRSIGWSWGGHWSSIKDYQHFSASGR